MYIFTDGPTLSSSGTRSTWYIAGFIQRVDKYPIFHSRSKYILIGILTLDNKKKKVYKEKEMGKQHCYNEKCRNLENVISFFFLDILRRYTQYYCIMPMFNINMTLPFTPIDPIGNVIV